MRSRRYAYSAAETMRQMAYFRSALEQAIRRLVAQGRVRFLRRGYYAVVPPEYRDAGARPAFWPIDGLLLMGTRPLSQRKKGRDLFDLWYAASQAAVSPERVVECLVEYLRREGHRVSRAEFEKNLYMKMSDPAFGADVMPLLSPSIQFSPSVAAEYVFQNLLTRLLGERWAGLPKTASG